MLESKENLVSVIRYSPLIFTYVITGMLALLLDTDLSSTQRDYGQTAQACGKALITLINEVLDRAKIEAGKLELEAVPFDIRAILDDVLSLFSEKSRHKGIEVRCTTML